MFMQLWKNRRRMRLVARPFPEPWVDTLTRNVILYARLSEVEQQQVRDYVQVFVAEKNWEGCGGFSMTDEARVTISALVGILVLGIEDRYFDRVLSILVYPGAFVADDAVALTQSGEWTLQGWSTREGEAWYRGPVILSWSEVLSESRDPHSRRNLVFHEFAHQLDMLNGHVSDGVPLMRSREQFEKWDRVMRAEFNWLVRDCEQRRHTFLDCYGAENRSEFFAVATEAFFQQPRELRQHHADLYQVLRDFFGQDPASR
jgi:Mlc titration factor MtfA (ptsG expression regulator)